MLKDYDYVVNTTGRSGSKMLIRCLRKHSVKVLSKRKPHDNHFLPNQIPKEKKVIFLYANPIVIYLSVRNQEKKKGLDWVKRHYNNLRGDFTLYKDCTTDSLGLEKMLI